MSVTLDAGSATLAFTSSTSVALSVATTPVRLLKHPSTSSRVTGLGWPEERPAATANRSLGGGGAKVLTFDPGLAPEELSSVSLEIDLLSLCPVFAKGDKVLPYVFGSGEPLAVHHCCCRNHDKVIVAEKVLCPLRLLLCVLHCLDVV